MTILTVENLTVCFPSRHGSVNAIEDVTLSVSAGEILGMVGESGAGKSMTGAAIIGLIEPPGHISQGEIRLEGDRIDNLRPEAMRRIRGRRIGAIFQDPLTSLNPVLTVGEQLIETIQTHLKMSKSEARSRAIDWLRRVGIPAPEARIDTYPHQYSGGMRQRVVIALALCAEPRLVIADEPTTALDVSVQAQIIALLRRLARETGVAVILVTHDMGVIAETADRVAVMYAGRIVEIGTVTEVLTAPKHPYTTGLMASIPRIGERPETLSQIEGAMPRPFARPDGCAFGPRCPHRMEICSQRRPESKGTATRSVACHLTEEVPV
ncbi:MAG: ABC transporter ATP-binding protein [Hoeflea sp.]|uniref:ABC transporter ATP-binding protein n=1 Tax=Hoeflea sp. TaxID=1940281 RepID=UPI0032970631